MKNAREHKHDEDIDTMRSEYDFSKAVRGVSAARYAQGANIVVVALDLKFSMFFRTVPVWMRRYEP